MALYATWKLCHTWGELWVYCQLGCLEIVASQLVPETNLRSKHKLSWGFIWMLLSSSGQKCWMMTEAFIRNISKVFFSNLKLVSKNWWFSYVSAEKLILQLLMCKRSLWLQSSSLPVTACQISLWPQTHHFRLPYFFLTFTYAQLFQYQKSTFGFYHLWQIHFLVIISCK